MYIFIKNFFPEKDLLPLSLGEGVGG